MFSNLFSKAPSPDAARVPAGQHLTKGFPVMTYGETPKINLANWQLKISGLATSQTFSWEQMMQLPQTEFMIDFHCVTTWSKLDVPWKGIKVTDFMQAIAVDPKATHLMQHCYGGYTTNMAIADFVRAENFFAFELAGEPLPVDHGGPLRLVVPHLYAWKSAKWLSGLEFLPQDQPGFWERNGYHHRGDPWKEERYSI